MADGARYHRAGCLPGRSPGATSSLAPAGGREYSRPPMRLFPGLTLAFSMLAVAVAQPAGAQGTAPAGGPTVVIETSLGEIRVALDAAHAPGTTANFLRY